MAETDIGTLEQLTAALDWCQEHYVHLEGEPDGKWYATMYSHAKNEEIEAIEDSLLQAVNELRKKVKEPSLGGVG